MLKKRPMLSSILSSILLVSYVFLVSLLLNNGSAIFGKTADIFTAVIMLLLLVFSVLICGLLLLGGPIYLYFEKNKKEACKMLLFNVIFLAIILFIVMLLKILL